MSIKVKEKVKWMNETLLHTPKNGFLSEQYKYNKIQWMEKCDTILVSKTGQESLL